MATSPLPVELLNFDGKQAEKNILLNWTTASETGNAYFSIQRSADGMYFREIGRVQGAGNSTQMLEYLFPDKNPLNDVNYYKLGQHDFDGNTSSSQMIAIKYLDDNAIKIENNPVKDQLQLFVQSETENKVTFSIINHLGKTISKTQKNFVKGLNKFTIPVDRLAKGSYFLKMESPVTASWTRFIKL